MFRSCNLHSLFLTLDVCVFVHARARVLRENTLQLWVLGALGNTGELTTMGRKMVRLVAQKSAHCIRHLLAEIRKHVKAKMGHSSARTRAASRALCAHARMNIHTHTCKSEDPCLLHSLKNALG